MKLDRDKLLASVGADTGNREDNDLYRTGPEATLGILRKEKLSGTIWEPACGMGDMSEVLKTRGRVVSTDLIDYGYGRGGCDFLTFRPRFRFDHIVTNPPFTMPEAFVYRALDLVTPGGIVVMLMRTLWLEGVGRRDGIYADRPPTRVWVMSKRPRIAKGKDGTFFTALLSFSWYVWTTPGVATGDTKIGWI